MADFNPFEDLLDFEGNFGIPSASNAFPALEAAGFDQSTTLNSWSTYPAPDAFPFPNQTEVGEFPHSPAGHFDVLQGDDGAKNVAVDDLRLPQFTDFADILHNDDFWNNIDIDSPLNDFEPDQSVPVLDEPKGTPKSNDFWTFEPIWGGAPSADLSAQFLLSNSPQAGMSPPPVPLDTRPITGLLGGMQHNYIQQQGVAPQGPAPEAMMYHLPEPTNYWTSAQNADYPGPEAARSPMLNNRKRKAADIDQSYHEEADLVPTGKRRKNRRRSTDDFALSDEESDFGPTQKQRKTKERARKMALLENVPRNVHKSVTQRLNTRTKTIMKFDPSKVYDPLPHAPASWSIFKYTSHGELETGSLYTPAQIRKYLYDHPLHTLEDGTYSPKTGGLRLWIQRNPADSRRRYPVDRQSNRCRFTNCFATHNVINQGHLRLCLDEQSHLNTVDFRTDPFHNAGYIHLNCLERLLDFPQLCRDLPILVDDRSMPAEPRCRNKMTPPGLKALDIAKQFIRACENQKLVGYPRGARPHAGTLVEKLMRDKLEGDHGFNFQQVQEGQGFKGSHGIMHLGDLEVEMRTRDLTRRPKYQNPNWEGPATKKRGIPKGRARKGQIDSSDEEDESESW
ncbi:MAG: hypothetical protein Q9182_001424 [Xanthomendoza sp. 2 TL-2023]